MQKPSFITWKLLRPHHHRYCSSCHTLRDGEPMVEQMKAYSPVQQSLRYLCPYCVRDANGCELIQKAYPDVYEIVSAGRYFHLRLLPQLQLFTGSGVASNDD